MLKLTLLLLVLIFSKAFAEQIGDGLFEFKFLSLFFADAALEGTMVDGRRIEGAPFKDVILKMTRILNNQSDTGLKELKKPFELGANYLSEFQNLIKARTEGEYVFSVKVDSLNSSLFTTVKGGQEVALPSGWVGHAIILNLSLSVDSGHFDLHVFNLGAGNEYHDRIADPSGTYPFLMKPWMSFVRIPFDLVLEDSFFILGLMNLKDPKMVNSSMDDADYFYRQFLGNFSKYRVVDDKRQFYVVKQRSGSCTVAACLARIMYAFGSVKEYTRARIQMGIYILQQFLNNYSKDSAIIRFAKSGVEFKNIIKFSLSSLAKDGFSLLALESEKDYTCYPSTAKFKDLMNDWQLFPSSSSISSKHNDFKILKEIVHISLQILSWIEPIKLDLSKYSSSLHLNSTKFIMVPGRTIKLSKFPFRGTSTFSSIRALGESYSNFTRPKMLPVRPISTSQHVFWRLGEIGKETSLNFICISLVNVVKSINFESSIIIDEDYNISTWQTYYYNLLQNFSKLESLPSLDCILAFQKFSFYLWKLAVLKDSQKKNSLHLADYLPPFDDCENWEMLDKDMIKYRESRHAYSLNIHQEKKLFCEEIANFSKGKVRHFIPNNEQPYDVNSELIDFFIESKQFTDFLESNSITSSERDNHPKMITCGLCSELMSSYPEFYWAHLIAVGSIYAREISFDVQSGSNLSKVFNYQACLYNIQAKSRTDLITKKIPKIETCEGATYLKNLISDLQTTLSIGTTTVFLKNFEHLNFSMTFGDPLFVTYLERLLFSSNFLNDALKFQPKFGSQLLSTFGDLFLSQEKAFLGSDNSSIASTAKKLGFFTDFSYIFVRVIYKLLILQNEAFNLDSGVSYWSEIYEFWFNLTEMVISSTSKINGIVKPFLGRINYLLAYILSLSRFNDRLRNAIVKFYPGCSNSLVDFNALMIAHFFAGVRSFSNSSYFNSQYPLKFLFKTGFLMNDVYFELLGINLNWVLLTSILEIFIQRIVGEAVKFNAASRHNNSNALAFTAKDGKRDANNQYVIDLTSGEIFCNGYKLISKELFLNDPSVHEFFRSDWQRALNGNVRYEASEVFYEITDYLVKGANYRIYMQRSTVIYRIISHRNISKYFEWMESSCTLRNEVEKDLGLISTKTLDLYTSKENSTEFAWMSRKSNALIYYASFSYNSFFEIPALNSRLFSYFQQETVDNIFIPNVVQKFASKIPINLYSDCVGTAIILLQPFVFENDTPLAFIIQGEEVLLMNDQSFKLHSKQVFNENEPFSPMIILSKKNEKESFQALIPKFDYNELAAKPTMYARNNQIWVKKFELKNDLTGFILQNRAEKLLLAYHNIYHWNFKEAKKLLSRDSIHHNNPFNDEEFKLLEAIESLNNMSHPEGLALKLMASLHLKLNYIENLSKRSNSNRLASMILEYFMSMRDLSKKFYVHLEFPELAEEIFKFYNYQMFFRTDIYSFSNSGAITISANKVPAGNIYRDNLFKPAEFLANLTQQFIKHLNTIGCLSETVKNLPAIKSILRDRKITGLDHAYWRTLSKLCYLAADEDTLSMIALYQSISDEGFIGEFIQELEKKAQYFANSGGCEYGFKIKIERLQTIRQDLWSKQVRCPDGSSTDPQLMAKLMRHDISEKMELRRPKNKMITANSVTKPEDKIFFETVAQEMKSWFSKTIPEVHEFNHPGRVFLHLNQALKSFENERRKFSFDKFKESSIMLKFQSYLVQRSADIKARIEHYKSLLQVLASDASKRSSLTWILGFLDKIFHQKKDKVFEDLYSCYFSGSIVCFENKFPHLSQGQAKMTHELTYQYYAEVNLLNYFASLEIAVEELELFRQTRTAEASVEIEIKAKNLQEELKKRVDLDARVGMPGILNFEFQSGSVRLRKEQVDDVISFTEKNGHDLPQSTVIQRMMAAGKTFVLGTLASVLKADGETLSILVPPSSLYQTNALSMQERTLKYFKSRGYTFHFRRLDQSNQSANIIFLHYVKYRLMQTIKNKDYLIMDPADLSAFHNSFVEYFDLLTASMNPEVEANREELQTILKLHTEIYQIFKTKTSIIFDEIDMTMAPNLELNYPTQEKETMNMNAATLSADLIFFLSKDAKVQSLGLHILSNNQHNFDQSQMESIRSLWKDHVTEKLKDIKSSWGRFIYNPIMLLLKDQTDLLELIVDFVFESSIPENFASKLKQRSRSTYATLAIIRLQVQKWIPESFNGAVFEKFGPSIANWATIKYAIPYSAANTPNEQSVFADRWETLNKTLLMYFVKPFTLEEISALAAEILNMMTQKEFGSAQAAQTFSLLTSRELKKLTFEDKLIKIDNSSIDYERIFSNKSDERVLSLITVYVLRKVIQPIEYFAEQITSNALNMVSMFGSVQGYSGTIDNINILPWTLVSSAARERDANEKNNGGIVSKLLRDKEPVIVMNNLPETAEEIFECSLADSESAEFNAFIDSGAFFKAFTNFKVAQAIFNVEKLSHIQTVIYYDETSNQTRFLKREDLGKQFDLPSTDVKVIDELTQTSLERRFTFYDQRHITGSDILQHPKTKALLSIGPKILLREILQGSLRLRQFMARQRVCFVTTQSVASLLKSKGISKSREVSIEELIVLAGSNEEEKQNKENIKLAFSKIDNEIRNFVLENLSKDVMVQFKAAKIAKKFAAARSLFVRSTREDPSEWLKEVVLSPKAKVMNAYIQFKIELLRDDFGNLSDLKERLEKLSRGQDYSIELFLEEMIPKAVSQTDGIELQVEQTEQQQTTIDQKAQQLEQASTILNSILLENLSQSGSEGKKKRIYQPLSLALLQNYIWTLPLRYFQSYFIRTKEACFITVDEMQADFRTFERELVKIGLGSLSLIFHDRLVYDQESAKPSILSPSIAKEGAGLVFVKIFICPDMLFMISAEGLTELLSEIDES